MVKGNLRLFSEVIVIQILLLSVVIHCASVIRTPQNFVEELKKDISFFIDIKRHPAEKQREMER